MDCILLVLTPILYKMSQEVALESGNKTKTTLIIETFNPNLVWSFFF